MFKTALQQYITNPADPLVVFNDSKVVIIKDKYPKALGHYLIIPKTKLSHLHPFEALANYELYQVVASYIDKARGLVVLDLKERGYKPENFDDFIKAGVHSEPSLDNVHIHVITKDFYSKCLKHKKHYNSFNTNFFVEFSDLPVPQSEEQDQSDEESDEEVEFADSDSSSNDSEPESVQHLEKDHIKLTSLLKGPMHCSYCNKTFGNSFIKLKDHLELEYKMKFSR